MPSIVYLVTSEQKVRLTHEVEVDFVDGLEGQEEAFDRVMHNFGVKNRIPDRAILKNTEPLKSKVTKITRDDEKTVLYPRAKAKTKPKTKTNDTPKVITGNPVSPKDWLKEDS